MGTFDASRLLSELFSKKTTQNIIAVIPAYNEEKYIEKVVSETKKYVDKVIVVDDASTDKTAELAKNAGAVVLHHPINLKKGAALKTGCEAALKLKADAIITLDGDGQHDPSEIPNLIKELENYDIVLGVREFNKNMPLNSKIGNIVLTSLSKILIGNKIHDLLTGFRAFKSNTYKYLVWETSDYSVETEMIKNIKKHNLSYTETRIKTIYRDRYKGTHPFHGLNIALNMIKWRFKP